MRLTESTARVLRRVLTFARQRGLRSVLTSIVRWMSAWLRGSLLPARRARRTFRWDGADVPYFHHRYHYTWLNERAVEVALAQQLLESRPSAEILEIGNVLGHYLPVSHTVVDKYEEAPGVLNVDVVDLDLTSRYDLILALSTLEHVGLDEETQDPTKPLRALEALERHLAPGGTLWVTVPVGYNPALDGALRHGAYAFTRLRALRRDAARNVWRQVAVEEVWDAPYDRLLYTAHGVIVAELTTPG